MTDGKLHGVVVRSTFQSQMVQSTPYPDHFWKWRCQKRARGFGAKRIFKSKVSKIDGLESGPPLEVEMSKKVQAVAARSKHIDWYQALPGRPLSTQLSTFERSLADSFLFDDAVQLKNCGRLANLVGFGCC